MVTKPTQAANDFFNSRSTSPEEVAAGFVAPPQFWDIVRTGNTVVVGPRGSGKTTVLKMLQGRALEKWDDSQAERARDLATYSGIFVAADRSWTGQVTAVGGQLDDELRTNLGGACFVLHVLRALVRCAEMRLKPIDVEHPHDRVSISPDEQEKIVRELWRSWALKEPVGSLAGLRFALTDLIADLGRTARAALRNADGREHLAQHPALDLDVIDATISFIERFNHAAGQEDHVWTFLIDEIEFLPQGISYAILRGMRGKDPRINQKVSLAPYTIPSRAINDALGGWEDHDLKRVVLTFPDRNDGGHPFSRELAERELGDTMTPEQLLGEGSRFESAPGQDAYADGSRNLRTIESLAAKDPGFREWLSQQGLDLERLEELPPARKAATLRKAMPIIIMRDEYLGEDYRLRSRKAPRTYVGETSTYTLCENNPRQLKLLMLKLRAAAESGKLDDGVRAAEIEHRVREYERHLRALEVPRSLEEAYLPRPFVARVGHSLAAGIYGRDFDPEPTLSFTVPSDLSEESNLHQALTQLAHYGAIVPSEDNPGQFRLAHTFAPLFKLPLRKGRTRSLLPMLSGIDPAQLHIDDEDGTE